MQKTLNKLSESELISLMRENSELAFSYLYDNYSAALYGIILRIVIDPDRSKDVLQDSFVKIWKNKDNFDGGKGTIFTWMLNIAKNSAIDSNRSKHEKNKIQIEVRIVDKESKIDGNIASDLIGLNETIEKLKPEFKDVLKYIYILGYTQQEYSDMFEIPLGTVKTRTRAALKEMRNLIKEKL